MHTRILTILMSAFTCCKFSPFILILPAMRQVFFQKKKLSVILIKVGKQNPSCSFYPLPLAKRIIPRLFLFFMHQKVYLLLGFKSALSVLILRAFQNLNWCRK